MRVISGAARGRPIKTIRSSSLRPTTDRVRGAIFSTLESLDASYANVLDLYAGTGALGIEALSRGAESAVLVEKDRRLARQIQENLRALDMAERGTVLTIPVEVALNTLEDSFTLIFADPPYADEDAVAHIMSVLVTSPAMKEDGMLAVEHAARMDPSAESLTGWVQLRHKVYGDTGVSIYRKEGSLV